MTGDDVIKISSAFANWVASHVVAIGAFVMSIIPGLQLLEVVDLTSQQISGIQLVVGTVVAAVTGKGTVDKPRFGERVDEKVAEKMPAAVEKEITARAETGVFSTPFVPPGGGAGGSGSPNQSGGQ